MGMVVKGLDQLTRKLKNIDRSVRRANKKVVSKAANRIVSAARSKASKESGALKRSIGKKVISYRDDNHAIAVIGPRSKFSMVYKGKKRVPANYSHLVHNGHLTANGKHFPGNPFLKNAMDEEGPAAVAEIRANLVSGIVKEATK